MGKLLKKPKVFIFLLTIVVFSAVVFYYSQDQKTIEVAQAQPAGKTYLDGQIIVDPENPAWLKYHNGGSFYMSGLGDPEDFLYRGNRKPDGTRDGTYQVDLINKLAATGANSLYLQIVKSHGGDGDNTENPFVDGDETKGLDSDIINQWKGWFDLMDQNGIVIFLFFYDDETLVWDTGHNVGVNEQNFIEGIVNEFKGYKNLIWVIAEEYTKSVSKLSDQRISNIADVIKEADDHDHIIASHQEPGFVFNHADDPDIEQFAWQTDGATHVEWNAKVVAAWNEANGRYSLNMAEPDGLPSAIQFGVGDKARKKAWSIAMGGSHLMVYEWFVIYDPTDADLWNLGRIVKFMKARNLTHMAPHNDIVVSGTAYVLADPGNEYAAYLPNGGTVVLDLLPGTYYAQWYHPINGVYTDIGYIGGTKNQSFSKPAGTDWALLVTRADGMIFPAANWTSVEPEDVGVDKANLVAAMSYLNTVTDTDNTDKALVVRNGYMIWNGADYNVQQSNVWSVTKSFTSSVLGLLVDDGKTSLNAFAKNYDSSLTALYPNLTLKHFTTHTSGYRAVGDAVSCHATSHGQSPTPFTPTTPSFAPGTKFEYWDSAMNEFAKVLTIIANEKIEDLFKREIASKIGMTAWSWGEWSDTASGYQINGGAGNAKHNISISASELARFCHLYLNQGTWNGQELISSSWVNQATSVQVPSTMNACSLKEGPGVYGYNWWVNDEGLWPAAPAGTFQALGFQDNFCFVIPEYDMVIVRLGDKNGTDVSNAQYNTFLEKISASILTTGSCDGLSCGETCDTNKICNADGGVCVSQQDIGGGCGCNEVCLSGSCNICDGYYEPGCWECQASGPTCSAPDIASCDQTIDTADLTVLKNLWGQAGSADFNQDNITNVLDLGIMMSTWGN